MVMLGVGTIGTRGAAGVMHNWIYWRFCITLWRI